MILYLGNMLSKHGGSVSMIETLAPKLSEHYQLEAFSNKKNQIFRLWDMLKALWTYRHKTDVVLIDSYSTKAFWYTVAVAFCCRILKIKYIPILRGGDFPNRLQHSIFWCKFVFNHSVANVSPSKYLEEHFTKAGYEVIYIPNFLPIEAYHFKERKMAKPKMLWVRAFHSIYNPVMAIDVLDRLVQHYPDAELCMVGSDSDGSRALVESRAEELGLTKHLRLTGVLSKKAWTELSSGYDIFINTTDFDNMPVTVIEAMALGLPVVSTNAGGLPYLLNDEHDSLLVEKGSVDEMLNQILRVLEEEALSHKLSSNARKKAQTFDWSNVKPLWLELLPNGNNV